MDRANLVLKSLLVLLAASAFSVSSSAFNQNMPSYSANFIQPVNWQGSPHNGPVFSQPSLQPNVTGDDFSSRNKTMIWPNSISYSRGIKFSEPFINEDLRFGIRYAYNFRISLFARNSSAQQQQIPDGFYLLNMAVLLGKDDSIYQSGGTQKLSSYDRYVTSATAIVPVTAGQFSKSIVLNFPNVTATTLMNHLYVELIPLKEKCGESACITLDAKGDPDPHNSQPIPLDNFTPHLVEVPFVPYLPASSSMANPGKSFGFQNSPGQTLTDYIHKALIHRAAHLDPSGDRSLDKYLNELKVERFSTDELSAQINRSTNPKQVREGFRSLFANMDLDSAQKNIDYALDVLCDMAYKPSGSNYDLWVRARCLDQPHEYLKLSQVTRIGSVKAEIKRLKAHHSTFNLMANFMLNRSRSYDTFTNLTIKPLKPFSPIFKLLDAFGVPLSDALDAAHTVNTTNSESSSESMIGSQSTLLDYNINTLVIPTLNSQRCLIVVGTQTKQGRPLAICDTKKDLIVTETYLHAFERIRDTSTIDAFDPLAQTVNYSLRGERDISTFSYLIRKNITARHDSRIMPFDVLKKMASNLSQVPLNESKIIVQPIQIGSSSSPSFLKMLLFGYKEEFISDK